MNHPEDECKGCGDKIPDEREGNYCSFKCWDSRPLGTGYSKSDFDFE